MDTANSQYAGPLGTSAVVRRLATASVALGSAAEYLFQTCDGLRAHGIPDHDLDRLASLVRAVQHRQNSASEAGLR